MREPWGKKYSPVIRGFSCIPASGENTTRKMILVLALFASTLVASSSGEGGAVRHHNLANEPTMVKDLLGRQPPRATKREKRRMLKTISYFILTSSNFCVTFQDCLASLTSFSSRYMTGIGSLSQERAKNNPSMRSEREMHDCVGQYDDRDLLQQDWLRFQGRSGRRQLRGRLAKRLLKAGIDRALFSCSCVSGFGVCCMFSLTGCSGTVNHVRHFWNHLFCLCMFQLNFLSRIALMSRQVDLLSEATEMR